MVLVMVMVMVMVMVLVLVMVMVLVLVLVLVMEPSRGTHASQTGLFNQQGCEKRLHGYCRTTNPVVEDLIWET